VSEEKDSKQRQPKEASEPRQKATPKAPSPNAKPAGARPRPTPRKPAPPKELPPSPKESLLQEYRKRLEEKFGSGIILEAMVNQAGDHTPTFTIEREKWRETAAFVKEDEHFCFHFVQNYSGVDYETYLEVVLHLYSLSRNETICLKTKLEREKAEVESLTPVWKAADWNEREMYDLLGIQFVGHPDLRRILLPENWVGHPLRKDYEPYDEGV
jgi:NADH-quinone oxidoreductase subunit C